MDHTGLMKYRLSSSSRTDSTGSTSSTAQVVINWMCFDHCTSGIHQPYLEFPAVCAGEPKPAGGHAREQVPASDHAQVAELRRRLVQTLAERGVPHPRLPERHTLHGVGLSLPGDVRSVTWTILAIVNLFYVFWLQNNVKSATVQQPYHGGWDVHPRRRG
jgi:hypothetical protein